MTKGSQHNRRGKARLTRVRNGTLIVAFLGALLAVPFVTNAQTIGTADPTGGVTLAGSDNTFTNKGGNPVKFDSTIQFLGLTASGQAQNNYLFSSNALAVFGSETLSVSGTLAPGNNNAYATLLVGSSLTGQSMASTLPDGADYFYNLAPFTVTVKGVLAPGDSAFFDVDGKALRSNGSPCTDLLTGQLTQYFFSKTFTNTGTDMMTFGAAITFPGAYLGDWFDVRESQNYPTTLAGEFQEYITKTKTSSSAESWIEVDPALSLVATVNSVPEPSSLVLAGLGLLCMVAYAARQRSR
jgi:hypothetical protein